MPSNSSFANCLYENYNILPFLQKVGTDVFHIILIKLCVIMNFLLHSLGFDADVSLGGRNGTVLRQPLDKSKYVFFRHRYVQNEIPLRDTLRGISAIISSS